MSAREGAGRVRTFAAWTLAQGISRLTLRLASRLGDPVSQLVVVPEMRENPFPTYHRLRARSPIVDGRVVTATTGYDVSRQVLRSEEYGVGGGHGELPPAGRRLLERLLDPLSTGPLDPPSLLALDAPDHTRLRKLVAKEFTPRSMASMEPRIEAVAEQLLDRLTPGSTVDLVDRYASLLPVAVIADLLGIPTDQHLRLLRLGNDAALALDPGLSWKDFRRADSAVRELHLWFIDHIARLRRDPGDDLLSRLTLIEGTDDRLDDLELRGLGLLLLGAGFETTVNLIGNAVKAFAEFPDQLDLVRADPSLWPNAVEEALRYDSPVQVTMRVAQVDTELAGRDLPAGRPVLVLIGAANRDPEVFAHPDAFDVTRANADKHLALSAGAHYCLGAGLARLETAVALRTLYERFPDLRVEPGARRRPTRVLRGHERLTVTLVRRPRMARLDRA